MTRTLATTDPIRLLQELIRFDTSNPPGHEVDCIQFLDRVLRSSGLATEVVARDPRRPNLIARLPGRGEAAPLLFCGHVDVVPAGRAGWTHPPFAGDIADGCVWGRGALDMKGGVAMMVSAAIRAARDGVAPAGDVILALVADEESGGGFGAGYVVENRPDILRGVRHAVCEFGGFPLRIAGHTFAMIQVAEKTPSPVDVIVRGPAGHGARPVRGGAMARLGRILDRLDTRRLPIHITPVTREMVERIASGLPRRMRPVVRSLLHPALTDRVLAALGGTGRTFEPLFRNTVNATIVRGGERINVIPSEIHLALDARLLPGYTTDDLRDELESILQDDGEARFVADAAPAASPDLAFFDLLAACLARHAPEAVSVPFLLPGSTDGRHLARLGIQTCGFTPMTLPPGLSFLTSIHAADERIPVEAVTFGTDVLYDVIRTYGASGTGP